MQTLERSETRGRQFPSRNVALRERGNRRQSQRAVYDWRFSFFLPPVKNIGCSGINMKGDVEGENREESGAQVKDNSGEHVIQRRGRGQRWVKL